MKDLIEAHGKQGRKAAFRAFRKLLKWYRGQVASYATKELGISRKAFKSRWFLDNSNFTLWMGLNPVSAHLVGKAKQNRTGVRVSKYDFDGAFIAKMNYGNSLLVMRRVGKQRLPIEKEFVEVHEEITLIFKRFEALAVKRFETLFTQELNFVRNHEKLK